MKNLMLVLSLAFIFVSCAHSSKSKSIYDEMQDLEYKNHTLLKSKVENILNNHAEFDQAMKAKLKKIIFTSLDKSMEIKKKESKVAQLLLLKTIKNKGSFDEIVAVKKKMKEVYNSKYALFENTANELKAALNIKSSHNDFLIEIEPFLHR